MAFTVPDIAGGATAVNKSGYSSTIICGSNAAGEPIPPHFQLKTLAQTEEKQPLSVDWFTSTKTIVAQFGHESKQHLSCTLETSILVKSHSYLLKVVNYKDDIFKFRPALGAWLEGISKKYQR